MLRLTTISLVLVLLSACLAERDMLDVYWTTNTERGNIELTAWQSKDKEYLIIEEVWSRRKFRGVLAYSSRDTLIYENIFGYDKLIKRHEELSEIPQSIHLTCAIPDSTMVVLVCDSSGMNCNHFCSRLEVVNTINASKDTFLLGEFSCTSIPTQRPEALELRLLDKISNKLIHQVNVSKPSTRCVKIIVEEKWHYVDNSQTIHTDLILITSKGDSLTVHDYPTYYTPVRDHTQVKSSKSFSRRQYKHDYDLLDKFSSNE